jgi:large subunit ribosomal protein L15
MHFEGFEGGQSPLQRRLPKFGFNPPNRKEFALVDLDNLETFSTGATVDEAALRKKGFVKGQWTGLKVLGSGKLTKKLIVKAHRFSASAKDAIAKVGGSVEELPLMEHKPEAAAKAHAGKGPSTSSGQAVPKA